MNTISDIMFWISTGLLVPVIVLLILLFFSFPFAGREFLWSICFYSQDG